MFNVILNICGVVDHLYGIRIDNLSLLQNQNAGPLILGYFSCLNAEELKKMPAPEVAVKYYTGGDLYLFGKIVFWQCLHPHS